MHKCKVVVFGGNGFIGSHFVDKLVQWGHEVSVFDRFTLGKDNLGGHGPDCVRRVAGDFRDQDAVGKALRGMDIAYNFISVHNPISSWDKPQEAIDNDVLPALELFESCVDHDLKKIVYISSGGTVYGPHIGTLSEDILPRPFNPHGISKLMVEHFLEYYRVKSGIAADVYRVGNVFGPRQRLESDQGVIAVWMKRILNGQSLDVFGDRHIMRDYTFVTDVATLMGHSLCDLTASGTYNVGTGKGVSIIALLEMFKEVVNEPFDYRVHPRRVSDNTSAVLSSEKILRYYPGFVFQDLKASIKSTWDYVKAHYRLGEVGSGHLSEERQD